MGREDARALVRETERDHDLEHDDDDSDADLDLDYSPEAALYKPTDNISLGLRGRRSPLPGALPAQNTEEAVIPVYVTIHRIRRLVIAAIDEPYSLDQLQAPRLNAQLVRPLVDRLYNPDDLSTVYCLLANRVQFLRSQEETLRQTVNIARAIVCELVATRILRRFHEDNPGRPGLLLLANILVSGFDAFDAAPEALRKQSRAQKWHERGGHERKLIALELAILSESKILIGSLACQRVVDAVHRGQVVYTPLSLVDILPDHVKHHPVSLYEPRRAAILNHRRLIVPQLRNLIELVHFSILLVLYILTMTYCNGPGKGTRTMGIYEIVFDVFTAGWVLEQFAAIVEHGWEVHAQNLWSFLDVTFILIFGVYGAVRVVELLIGIDVNYALPILCTAAPILLTRVAFNLMPDNIVFIALHAMMRDFTRLTFIAIWCFTGFLLGLLWLMRTAFSTDEAWDNTSPSWATIGKWLLWIWFGLDGTGLERTAEFHTVLGPALAVTFAFLGNTLFLTILVAILTNTFSKIMDNAAAEVQFRRAVLTFQAVKSDSIFAYPPPFNMIALVIMLPLRMCVGPVAFHTINVGVIRAVNAPVLLLIALYERRHVWTRGMPSVPRRGWTHFGLSPYGDIQLVFAEPPPEVLDQLEKLDHLDPMIHHDISARKSRDIDTASLASFVRRRKPSDGSEHDRSVY